MFSMLMMQTKFVIQESTEMQKPDDHITVGIITLPYSHILNGWIMPDGSVISNPIKAQREAERLNKTINITIH